MSDLETALEDCQQELDTAIASADALAAEVERLRAENADLRGEPFAAYHLKMGELYREVERLSADNAALRAQLDAGGGWRAVTEPSDPSDWVQVRGRGRCSPSGLWAVGIQEWRPLPAPPQE